MDAELVHPDGLTSEHIDQLLCEAAAGTSVGSP
jgi:hypothetical protein